MASIFGYTDDDGDILRVDTRSSGDFLAFRIPADVEGQVDGRGVDIPRDHVLELHAALGEWLYPTHTPEAKNRSLIEQMIEKAVKDQVAAILPLHLAPGASFRISGPCAGHVDGGRDPEPGDVGHPRPSTECPGCTPLGCTDFSHDGPAEPEPFVPFTACKCHDSDGNSISSAEPVAEPHFPSLHMATESECRAVGCAAARHLSEPATQHGRDLPDELRRNIYGRLMAELPRRPRPRMQRPEDWGPGIACGEKIRQGQLLADVHQACGYAWAMHPVAVPIPDKCQECLHGWVEHTSGICWGVGGDGNACRCTRERP